jgi:hypothetical protein
MRGTIPPLPNNMPSWRGAQLKHRSNFTFTFTKTAQNYKLCNFMKRPQVQPVAVTDLILQNARMRKLQYRVITNDVTDSYQ